MRDIKKYEVFQLADQLVLGYGQQLTAMRYDAKLLASEAPVEQLGHVC